MKKIICTLISVLLALSMFALAEESGVYVPSYQTFFDNFNSELAEIDESYCESLSTYREDKTWEEVASGTPDRFIIIDKDAEIEISSHEYYGQLALFTMRFPVIHSVNDSVLFTKIVKVSIRSIFPEIDEDAVAVLFQFSGMKVRLEKYHDALISFPHNMHMVSSVSKDEYVYFFIEILRDDGGSKWIVTPYGYEEVD